MTWYNPASWFRRPPVRWYNPFSWFAEPPMPAVHAAVAVLAILDRELGDSPLPGDLRKISDAIHHLIPISIRDGDSATERAEFALAIQRGALFLRAMKDWYQ